MAAFFAAFCIAAISAAFFAQGIKGAKAKQAIEIFFLHAGMAGEMLAFPVLKKAGRIGFFGHGHTSWML